MASPFVRSAGGKRLLAPAILDRMPISGVDAYVEPFVGGGAVYFALQEAGRLEHAIVILGDVDKDLVALYEAVRDRPAALIEQTDRLIGATADALDPRVAYNAERAIWNSAGVPSGRHPARHLYLRSACFNGLWRTNKQGHMNVPFKDKPPSPVDAAKLTTAHYALNHPKVELVDWDFRHYDTEDSGVFIGSRTLVYLDPPYLDGGFNAYTEHGWREDDLRALFQLATEWASRGAHVVFSHSDTPLVRQLARGHEISRVGARRSINSDGENRGPVPEVIVTFRPAQKHARLDTGV